MPISKLKAFEISSGVSKELADFRKNSVSQLSYQLLLSIPSDKNQPVSGNVSIRFYYSPSDENKPLLIDFREDTEKIKSVVVNGSPAPFNLCNEHIVLNNGILINAFNTVDISFIAGEQSLNRNNDYIYTLFVPDRARTVFPCFDQPNLKANFNLTLEVPPYWVAVSNSPVATKNNSSEKTIISFKPTEPLSTYLFAFAAGNFHRMEMEKNGRNIGAFFRDNTPERCNQVNDILNDVFKSLDWLENFTGVKYPFAKYELVILPGFQFGGMEHTGATFYNDRTMFLHDNPTPDEILSRTKLIAHETAHMWFGDLVTMDWFNDVWTKEVFANYFGAEITRQLHPGFDHDFEWNKRYVSAAMDEDRSMGGTAIRQNLDNLQNAGLVYNNIIYNKAPVMMKKLVDLIGKDAFHKSIHQYLTTYAYRNATWDNLVDIFQKNSSVNICSFSDVWVYRRGMPIINSSIIGDSLIVEQSSPLNDNSLWAQKFNISIIDGNNIHDYEINFNVGDSRKSIYIGKSVNNTHRFILPNSDGRGYGLFTLNHANIAQVALFITDSSKAHRLSPSGKMATLLNLNELYLHNRMDAGMWITTCLNILRRETDPQTATTLAAYAAQCLEDLSPADREDAERKLIELAQNHSLPAASTSLLRNLTSKVKTDYAARRLYEIWENESMKNLSRHDYINLALYSALRFPDASAEILSKERNRIKQPDQLREFDFISRAAVADSTAKIELFKSFLVPENRRIEPWTASALSMLCNPQFNNAAEMFIEPGLNEITNVQKTGDIFFPGKWANAILGNMRSPQAADIFKKWLTENKDSIQPMLMNKILNGAYGLIRANEAIFKN